MPKITKYNNLFTSESVCKGHPDKIADGISDAILDQLLIQDKYSKTGIECVVGNNQIALYGEISSEAQIDYHAIVKQQIHKNGYTVKNWGFHENSNFNNYLHQQSSDIAVGVDTGGAGDQGMMFGFACNQTSEYMPLPIAVAHAITAKIDQVRESKILSWLRPDGKAQVTINYNDPLNPKIEKLVLAVAHDESVGLSTIRKDLILNVLEEVLDNFKLSLPSDSNIIINGTGVWHIPGPASDAGLTGRKIVVDGYGGYARVGGGAFSGKDPSKVDRSGAYAARFIAKNIVAHGLADKCEVGLAYVIGRSKPLMQTIDTFNTSKYSLAAIHDFKDKLIDTSVNGIIDRLNLLRPIYLPTASYGHFGKKSLPWEELINNP